MRRLTPVLFLLMALLGTGCAPAAYVPGDQPTDVQLEQMSEAQKADAIREMLRQHPEPTLSEPEKQAMQDGSRNVLAGGTPERLADFQSRAHHAEGMVRIIRKDGKLSVVLGEDFVVDAGPQLYVYASGNPNPTNRADLHANGAWELGRLRSTIGMQAYPLPDDATLNSVKSVVIYCKPFGVIFAVAAIE